ncbi:nitrilase-related carbon-nitrogen hydrolase [Candidatus Venteria ishoeyi]|uniref:nitrilase-related carbon-nitrogen hydrolase n=1 Tax=Candidatus Venteria ishoeyi TaxID=1899563 RepID=UPI0025A52F58|nr:nitrilase-related carbon-nitrogen hydrolase [Candidatus Venteria ishoeyi]MDM8546193.1 nitrilase-related carbon-nitrogen hydrolase [Candidatus Venteria ishoeyi]
MKIAILQSNGFPGEKQRNLEYIEKYASHAAQQGADMLITAELFISGYHLDARTFHTLSEPVHGASILQLQNIAQKYAIAIVTGWPERDGEAMYNSAVLIDKNAKVLLH